MKNELTRWWPSLLRPALVHHGWLLLLPMPNRRVSLSRSATVLWLVGFLLWTATPVAGLQDEGTQGSQAPTRAALLRAERRAKVEVVEAPNRTSMFFRFGNTVFEPLILD